MSEKISNTGIMTLEAFAIAAGVRSTDLYAIINFNEKVPGGTILPVVGFENNEIYLKESDLLIFPDVYDRFNEYMSHFDERGRALEENLASEEYELERREHYINDVLNETNSSDIDSDEAIDNEDEVSEQENIDEELDSDDIEDDELTEQEKKKRLQEKRRKYRKEQQKYRDEYQKQQNNYKAEEKFKENQKKQDELNSENRINHEYDNKRQEALKAELNKIEERKKEIQRIKEDHEHIVRSNNKESLDSYYNNKTEYTSYRRPDTEEIAERKLIAEEFNESKREANAYKERYKKLSEEAKLLEKKCIESAEHSFGKQGVDFSGSGEHFDAEKSHEELKTKLKEMEACVNEYDNYMNKARESVVKAVDIDKRYIDFERKTSNYVYESVKHEESISSTAVINGSGYASYKYNTISSFDNEHNNFVQMSCNEIISKTQSAYEYKRNAEIYSYEVNNGHDSKAFENISNGIKEQEKNEISRIYEKKFSNQEEYTKRQYDVTVSSVEEAKSEFVSTNNNLAVNKTGYAISSSAINDVFDKIKYDTQSKCAENDLQYGLAKAAVMSSYSDSIEKIEYTYQKTINEYTKNLDKLSQINIDSQYKEQERKAEIEYKRNNNEYKAQLLSGTITKEEYERKKSENENSYSINRNEITSKKDNAELEAKSSANKIEEKYRIDAQSRILETELIRISKSKVSDEEKDRLINAVQSKHEQSITNIKLSSLKSEQAIQETAIENKKKAEVNAIACDKTLSETERKNKIKIAETTAKSEKDKLNNQYEKKAKELAESAKEQSSVSRRTKPIAQGTDVKDAFDDKNIGVANKEKSAKSAQNNENNSKNKDRQKGFDAQKGIDSKILEDEKTESDTTKTEGATVSNNATNLSGIITYRKQSTVIVEKALKTTVKNMNMMVGGKIASTLTANEYFEGVKGIKSGLKTASTIAAPSSARGAQRFTYRMLDRKGRVDANFNSALAKAGVDMSNRKKFESRKATGEINSYFLKKGIDLKRLSRKDMKKLLGSGDLNDSEKRLLKFAARDRKSNLHGGKGRNIGMRTNFAIKKLLSQSEIGSGFSTVNRSINNVKRAVASTYRTARMVYDFRKKRILNKDTAKVRSASRREVFEKRQLKIKDKENKKQIKNDNKKDKKEARANRRKEFKDKMIDRLKGSRFGQKIRGSKTFKIYKRITVKVKSSKIAKIAGMLKKFLSGAFDFAAFMKSLLSWLMRKIKLYAAGAVVVVVFGVIFFTVINNALDTLLTPAFVGWFSKDNYSVKLAKHLTSIQIDGEVSPYNGTMDADWYSSGVTSYENKIKGSGLTGYLNPKTGIVYPLTTIDQKLYFYTTASGTTLPMPISNAKEIICAAETKLQLDPEWDYSNIVANGKGYEQYGEDLFNATHKFEHSTKLYSCPDGCETINYKCTEALNYTDSSGSKKVSIIDGDIAKAGIQNTFVHTTSGCTKKHAEANPLAPCSSCNNYTKSESANSYYTPIELSKDGKDMEFTYNSLDNTLTHHHKGMYEIGLNIYYGYNSSSKKTEWYYAFDDDKIPYSFSDYISQLGDYSYSIIITVSDNSSRALGICKTDIANAHILNGGKIYLKPVMNNGLYSRYRTYVYKCNEWYCPGHKAKICKGHVCAYIYEVVTTLEDNGGDNFFAAMKSIEKDAKGNPIYGTVVTDWDNERARSIVHTKYNTDWKEYYDITFVSPMSAQVALKTARLSPEDKETYTNKCLAILNKYYAGLGQTEQSSGNNAANSWRMKVVQYALDSYGTIPYDFGGKAKNTGYGGENAFGTTKTFKEEDGEVIRELNGLDCSGWVAWVYLSSLDNQQFKFKNTSKPSEGFGFGTYKLALANVIDLKDPSKLIPGDILVFNQAGDGRNSHIAIYLYTDEATGNLVYVHENGGADNVSIGTNPASYWSSRNTQGVSSAFIRYLD